MWAAASGNIITGALEFADLKGKRFFFEEKILLVVQDLIIALQCFDHILSHLILLFKNLQTCLYNNALFVVMKNLVRKGTPKQANN